MIALRVPLTQRQAQVKAEVERYYRATGEACPARYLSRRLGLNPETVRDHFAALYRKGHLLGNSSPAIPIPPATA